LAGTPFAETKIESETVAGLSRPESVNAPGLVVTGGVEVEEPVFPEEEPEFPEDDPVLPEEDPEFPEEDPEFPEDDPEFDPELEDPELELLLPRCGRCLELLERRDAANDVWGVTSSEEPATITVSASTEGRVPATKPVRNSFIIMTIFLASIGHGEDLGDNRQTRPLSRAKSQDAAPATVRLK
jgi:hypothetical protein